MGCESSKPGNSPLNEEDDIVGSPPDNEAVEEGAKMKAHQGRSRRAGVAAESLSADKVKDYKKPVYQKEQAASDQILGVLQDNEKMKVLFGHLDKDKLMDVVNAFYSKDFSSGENIIRQGLEGDCLYIVSSGSVDVFVKRPGVAVADERGPKVCQLGSGSLFGELALMYNAPRAATVTAVGKVSTFKLDAVDFKMLLAQSGAAQAAQYEGWLREVEILKMLNHYELSRLADILESEPFDPGEEIVKQGTPGDRFYILEGGTCAAYMTGAGGEKEVRAYETAGDYFGEIALLTAEPRQATVRATGDGCNVVSVSMEDFTAVMGPISDVLKQHADKYPQYADVLR